MQYKKEVNNFEKALSITEVQAAKLKSILTEAYDQHWHPDGPNVDQINAFIAPHLNTPEEAFYAAQVIMSDVFGAIIEVLNKQK